MSAEVFHRNAEFSKMSAEAFQTYGIASLYLRIHLEQCFRQPNILLSESIENKVFLEYKCYSEVISASVGNQIQNVEPSPCTESKPICPFSTSAIALQIDNPSPVP